MKPQWLLLLFVPFLCFGQGFQFRPGRHQEKIPYQFINNLIFIPVELNGVPLTFLLDTGVDDTILFSLDDAEEMTLSQAEPVQLRGLGSETPVRAIRSAGNRMQVGGLTDFSHAMLIVLEQDFNFSTHIGIAVHGILGSRFFRDHLVQIDYERHKLRVMQRDWAKASGKLRRFDSIPMTIEMNKPYIPGKVDLEGSRIPVKMLLDTGNSDAVWLFRDRGLSLRVLQPNLTDYLGQGFSGEVHGLRARIPGFELNDRFFPELLAAFPEPESIRNLNFVENRVGSVGGELLRRYTVVLDYKGGQLFLKPNAALTEPFRYNMSGLTIEHDGYRWTRQEITGNEKNKADIGLVYSAVAYELKPSFRISSVLKGSPAAEAGLQEGDILISISGRQAHKYTLEEINALLRSEEGRTIKLRVERKGREIKAGFRLRKIL